MTRKIVLSEDYKQYDLISVKHTTALMVKIETWLVFINQHFLNYKYDGLCNKGNKRTISSVTTGSGWAEAEDSASGRCRWPDSQAQRAEDGLGQEEHRRTRDVRRSFRNAAGGA